MRAVACKSARGILTFSHLGEFSELVETPTDSRSVFTFPSHQLKLAKLARSAVVDNLWPVEAVLSRPRA